MAAMRDGRTDTTKQVRKRYGVQISDKAHARIASVARATNLPMASVIDWIILKTDRAELIRGLKDGGVKPRRRGRPKEFFHQGD